jgi:hypothetical protein
MTTIKAKVTYAKVIETWCFEDDNKILLDVTEYIPIDESNFTGNYYCLKEDNTVTYFFEIEYNSNKYKYGDKTKTFLGIFRKKIRQYNIEKTKEKDFISEHDIKVIEKVEYNCGK